MVREMLAVNSDVGQIVLSVLLGLGGWKVRWMQMCGPLQNTGMFTEMIKTSCLAGGRGQPLVFQDSACFPFGQMAEVH